MNKEYKCTECFNSKTPLCDMCTCIESTDGSESKPKYYQGMGGITIEGAELERLVNTISARALAYVPISLRLVLKYNELISCEE